MVPAERLAAANSFSNLAESAGQLMGMAMLAPVLVKLPGSPFSLIAVCGVLLSYAAVRAISLRLTVANLRDHYHHHRSRPTLFPRSEASLFFFGFYRLRRQG